MNLYFYSEEKLLTIGGDGKPVRLFMETVPQNIAYQIPNSCWQPKERLFEHVINTLDLPLKVKWQLVTVNDYIANPKDKSSLLIQPAITNDIRSVLVTSIKKNSPTLSDALMKLKDKKIFDLDERTSRLPHVILHAIDRPIIVNNHVYRMLE